MRSALCAVDLSLWVIGVHDSAEIVSVTIRWYALATKRCAGWRSLKRTRAHSFSHKDVARKLISCCLLASCSPKTTSLRIPSTHVIFLIRTTGITLKLRQLSKNLLTIRRMCPIYTIIIICISETSYYSRKVLCSWESLCRRTSSTLTAFSPLM